MEIAEILFAFFTIMVVLPVIFLIFTRNIIRAAFALVIAFLGLAAIYVLLNAELMAVVQILIYAGGVVVLLIFGIMLTKRMNQEGVFSGHRNTLLGGLIFLVVLGFLMALITSSGLTWASQESLPSDQVRTVGIMFLTDYLLGFEIIAFLLLVALVGSAYLAKKSGNI
ncbi:MAG: NADH-quinone oxidoreductase subunit J [Marinoscillum sp.]